MSKVNGFSRPSLTWLEQRAEGWLQAYEDFVGLTEVKAAQNKVIESEKCFLEVQNERREKNQQLLTIQMNLKQISNELEKTNRTDDKYLSLLTEEHTIIRSEKSLEEELRKLEKHERESFSMLSTSLRESHEKERAQAERTKYWSVIGSIIGAFLGILGTTINNKLKMRELRSIVTDATTDGEKQRVVTGKLMDTLKGQVSSIESFVYELKQAILAKNSTLSSSDGEPLFQSRLLEATPANNNLSKLEEQTDRLLLSVKSQDEFLNAELESIKKLLLGQNPSDANNQNVIYVGPEINELFDNVNRRLEQKLKLNSLVTVTVVYSAFALTLPVLYAIFGRN